MHAIFKAVFYLPLYNALIFFVSIIPYHNIGVAVILFTCLIKVVLFPFSQKATRTQFKMKQMEGELKDIKEKYKDDKKVQAEKTMELYKIKGINPFSGIFLMLIQLPVLMTLYYIFIHAGFPAVNSANLYHFTRFTEAGSVGMNFFGIDVSGHSYIFAFLAAVAQFFQMKFTLPKQEKKVGGAKSFGDELSRSMNTQMKYVLPAIIFLIAKSFPVIVSLYLITSSIFAIGQELYVRRKSPVATDMVAVIK